MQQIYRITANLSMPKCDFNKIPKQIYWNHTLAWVFSCKFAAYFEKTFSTEHLWMAPSVSYWAGQNVFKVKNRYLISLLVLRELINLYSHWNHQKTNGFSKTKHEPWAIFTHSSIAFNVTFNQISHVVLVSLLLTLNKSYELFSYTFFISN